MNYLKTALWAFVFIITPIIVAKAQYIPVEQIIYANEPVEIMIFGAETLTIVYRPGSNISDTVRVQLEDNVYRWVPREAGIVGLMTPDGPVQTVSVRFEDYPFWGFFIMFGAAFILFGGAAYASSKLFGKPTTDEIASRPDT